MSENMINPKVGETWSLHLHHEDWYNGLVVAIKNNGEDFVTAKIICTELPVNYTGINIQIDDSFNTDIPSPFVVYLDSVKELPKKYFAKKRGQLSAKDLQRVLNSYEKIS